MAVDAMPMTKPADDEDGERAARREQGQRQGEPEGAAGGDQPAAEPVGGGGEDAADHGTGGDGGQHRAGLGVGQPEVGPERLKGAEGQEDRGLVGQADEQDGGQRRHRRPAGDRQEHVGGNDVRGG